MPYVIRDGRRVVRQFTREEIRWVGEASKTMLLREIGERFGLNRNAMSGARQRMVERGYLIPEGWLESPVTDEERENLKDYLPHYTVAEIARLLHRSEKTIRDMARKLTGGEATPLEIYLFGTYPPKEVARILGVALSQMQEWQNNGVLPAKKAGAGQCSRLYYEADAIRAFLQEYPYLYHPNSMAATPFRAYALRYWKPERRVTSSAAERLYGVTRRELRAAIRAGEIRAEKRKGCGNVWAIDVASLESWLAQRGERREAA